MPPVIGQSPDKNQAAVLGQAAPEGDGVFGDGGESGRGVVGVSQSHTGVEGFSDTGVGVFSTSNTGDGVHGVSHSPAGAAVIGINDNTGPGVRGVSTGFDGVSGTTLSSAHAGVAGTNDAGGIGVFGKGNPAGRFEGDVVITGDIILLSNAADLAEDFETSGTEDVEPGTLMVIGHDGKLHQSREAYDKRVAGVISGAGNLRPAIVLDKQGSGRSRLPIALMGKVYCKVDSQYDPIEVGDLLTTSLTPGHAMKAADPSKAFGAVIGKALRPLGRGKGLIPILIALQ